MKSKTNDHETLMFMKHRMKYYNSIFGYGAIRKMMGFKNNLVPNPNSKFSSH